MTKTIIARLGVPMKWRGVGWIHPGTQATSESPAARRERRARYGAPVRYLAMAFVAMLLAPRNAAADRAQAPMITNIVVERVVDTNAPPVLRDPFNPVGWEPVFYMLVTNVVTTTGEEVVSVEERVEPTYTVDWDEAEEKSFRVAGSLTIGNMRVFRLEGLDYPVRVGDRVARAFDEIVYHWEITDVDGATIRRRRLMYVLPDGTEKSP